MTGGTSVQLFSYALARIGGWRCHRQGPSAPWHLSALLLQKGKKLLRGSYPDRRREVAVTAFT